MEDDILRERGAGRTDVRFMRTFAIGRTTSRPTRVIARRALFAPPEHGRQRHGEQDEDTEDDRTVSGHPRV